MSELPRSWHITSLGEIGLVQSGVGFPNQAQGLTSGDYPVYKVSDVSRSVLQAKGNLKSANNYVSKETAASLKGYIFPAGSTLFAKIGEALKLNRRAFVIQEGLADNNVMGYKAEPGVSDRFVYHYLRTQNLAAFSRSTTVPSIRKGDVEEIIVLLPPADEQTRIAAKLDELLPQVDTLKARIDGIPPLLKRFRQSVLAAAVSGRLTEEWRTNSPPMDKGSELHQQIKNAHIAEGGHARGNASNPTEEAHDLSSDDLPDSWDIAELRDVCVPGRPITYGILKPGAELEEGVPYIRVADFPGNKLNIANIKKTSSEIDQQFKRARLLENDLLLSIRGSVGRLIKIPASLEGANITQDTARLSISPLISTDFVYWALLADSTQRRMKNATRGVAVRGINIGDVRALQIPLPPHDEQAEIVQRVEQLFAFADQLEARIKAAQVRIDLLTQSILAKAFRGELASQDPNDEPASLLLDRIKAQRAVAPKGKRGRRSATMAG
ncbi:restriction endonuclease subunit S [Pseudomonas mosselii]|uniref:restriction endonuclease subunit S n=1 Tax=Pseudomonas mosselii TaxID=78327 RepID=UPI00142D94FD|nr:restriction endonuclease subunit S [Pseudomonas mosselii]